MTKKIKTVCISGGTSQFNFRAHVNMRHFQRKSRRRSMLSSRFAVLQSSHSTKQVSPDYHPLLPPSPRTPVKSQSYTPSKLIPDSIPAISPILPPIPPQSERSYTKFKGKFQELAATIPNNTSFTPLLPPSFHPSLLTTIPTYKQHHFLWMF